MSALPGEGVGTGGRESVCVVSPGLLSRVLAPSEERLAPELAARVASLKERKPKVHVDSPPLIVAVPPTP